MAPLSIDPRCGRCVRPWQHKIVSKYGYVRLCSECASAVLKFDIEERREVGVHDLLAGKWREKPPTDCANVAAS